MKYQFLVSLNMHFLKSDFILENGFKMWLTWVMIEVYLYWVMIE